MQRGFGQRSRGWWLGLHHWTLPAICRTANRMSTAETTRFAPSPSGLLHLGHAYAALFAARAAEPGGRFLLRIEDIDADRARPEFEAAILEDLAWLDRKSTRLNSSQ